MTGGAGYIGSILVPALLAEGSEVTVLDSFMYGQTLAARLLRRSRVCAIVRGDCRDEATLRDALRGQDVVIALAALVGAPICDRDPIAATTTNLDAIRLLDRLRSRDQWVLYPNTNSGYGIGDRDAFCTEDSPLQPISLYGRTKVEAEQVAARARQRDLVPPRDGLRHLAAHAARPAGQRLRLPGRQRLGRW